MKASLLVLLILVAVPAHAQQPDPLTQLRRDLDQVNAAPVEPDPILRAIDRSGNMLMLRDDLDAAYGRSTLFTTEWMRRFEAWLLNDDFLDAVSEHNRALCDQ